MSPVLSRGNGNAADWAAFEFAKGLREQQVNTIGDTADLERVLTAAALRRDLQAVGGYM